MKYNLTNETYLPKTLSNFPGAPKMTILDMLGAALFYNIVPLIISLLTYYPIVYMSRRLFKRISTISILSSGFLLSITTPLTYLFFSDWHHNDYYLKVAEVLAWILAFIISISTYYLFNKRDVGKTFAIDSIL
ncbi:hypothetical protein GO755_19695 [Spirosoma sp. HMF4905]|uniref:Uncharacterized protein n=1 Tax=Spirosoma arboris TaxID=2682092 RepID=A0A7K1SEP2_9BACT|nr:hypothetical protein [Spirosoma arboris]MVM32280.1 hypothetical protein [Spirosoma arboris]